MRSYYEHLENVLHAGKDGNIHLKPTFRSSAIFPVMQVPGKIHTRLLYFGYWILKRHIKEITCVTTLRSEAGTVLIRNIQAIHDPKSFRIELSDMLTLAGLAGDASFVGSIELEFFSTKHMVYPFPAAAINYYGTSFSTIVHMAQRVYNDVEDMLANSKTAVPESGFNIYADDDHEPFISLVNGPMDVFDFTMEMEFINIDNEKMADTLTIQQLSPYETKYLYPARHLDLKTFLRGRPGTMKIRYALPWIFPRLIVGNIQDSIPALSITHSYYDCSKAKETTDYWLLSNEGTYPATLMLPLKADKGSFTNVNFYPIFSPSALTFDAEIFDCKGDLLGRKNDVVNFTESTGEYLILSVNALCEELGIVSQENLALRLMVRSKDRNPIPSRVKVGLDIGKNKNSLPCNICTNLIPYNPAVEKKPSSFRWMPLLSNRLGSTAWILDSSPKEKSTMPSACQLTFFRESDAQTIERNHTIAPHGFLVVDPDHDMELQQFLVGQIGWITIQTDNPYLSLFYFSEDSSGVVGGDHGF